MEKMELSEALKANASVLEGLLSGSSFFPFMDRGNLDSNSNFNLLPDTCLLYTSPSPRD